MPGTQIGAPLKGARATNPRFLSKQTRSQRYFGHECDATQVFSSCPAGHVMDCVQDLFLMLAQNWMQRAVDIARVIFLALAGLEIAVTGWVFWTRRGQQGDDPVGAIAVTLGVLAFILGALGS